MTFQNTFHLVIASVGETKFDGAVVSATIPTSDGEITVLAHHEPIVSTLKGGTLTVRRQGGEQQTFAVESGVLECSSNRAVVLL